MQTDLARRVDRHREKLTESDQRLLDVLFRNPTRAAMLSTSALAREAGVHSATAVRLAQKLGYGGYIDLRDGIRADLVGSDAARRVTETLATAESDLLASLVRSEVDTLVDLLRHVDQAAIDAAAHTLMAARIVFLCAQGNSVALAELLDRRLRRAGFRVAVATGSGRELAERLLALGPEDTLVAFAFRRLPAEIVGALGHARRTGARTLVIADQVARRLEPAPDHVLSAPRGRDDEFLTLTVPMAICNALVLTVARMDSGRSVAALDALTELAGRLG
jgi:DNA-binding MurR/RpiR family transcriptional regulator